MRTGAPVHSRGLDDGVRFDDSTLDDDVAPRPARRSRVALVALLSTLLYGCSGGLSCGDGGGCAGEYAYPQSGLVNGVQYVDDGARMRMTQSALDFLQIHLKDILIASLGSQSGNPDVIALQIPPAQLTGQDGDLLDVNLGQGNNETYPTTILIDASTFVDDLDMRFVQQGEVVNIGGQNITIAQDGILLDAYDIPVGLDARLFTAVTTLGITATAACDVDGSNPAYCPPSNPNCGLITGITLGILVYPSVATGAACDVPGIECLKINVDVVRAALGEFGTDAVEVSVPPHDSQNCNSAGAPPNCSPECSDQNLAEQLVGLGPAWECDAICFIEEFGLDLVFGLIGLVAPLLEGFLDDLLEVAIRDALEDIDGAPLALAGRFPIASALPVASPSTLDLGFSIGPTNPGFDVNCPAGQCTAAKGMDIIMKSGFEAAPDPASETPVPHPCVNAIQGAAFVALYGGVEFDVPTADPLTGLYEGMPYHVGASLAEQAVNQTLFAAYNSGALCLELSTDAVHVLAGGAFPLSVGTLDVLTGGKLRQFADPSAPVILSIVPHGPPVVKYGAGVDDGGHIKLGWEKAEVSFYALMYERFARVFSVTVDIRAGIAVYNDPESLKLKISIVDGPTVDNFQPTYNELMPTVAFDEIFADLIGLVFDAALSGGLEFDYDLATALSSALGVPLYINMQGFETVPATDPAFLNVYLSLTETPPPAPRMAHELPRLALAQNHGLIDSVVDAKGVTRGRPSGHVRLTATDVGLPPGYEVFALVDFGITRGPFVVDADGSVTIRDPKLRLPGDHTIEIRTRPYHAYDALDRTPRKISVLVDPYAPQVKLAIEGETLVAIATDVGTDVGDLTYTWLFDDRPGTLDRTSTSFPLVDLAEVRRVSVVVADRAGNVSVPASVDLHWLAARPSESHKEWPRVRHDVLEEGGCAALGSSTGSSSQASLALFAFALFALRRRPRKA
jgi:hypothetical protein